MRPYLALALAGAVVAACGETPVDTTTPRTTRAEAAPAATGPAGSATYSVSITNLTAGQYFTPPLVAVHRRATGLFRVGTPATHGVQEIAENGNLGPMLEALEGDRHVASFGVALAEPPPLGPGATRQIEVEGERGAQWVSWVAMLICTNDGFTGLSSARLPRDVGESVTFHAAGYDAGTEINTEDFDDLVPPCGLLSGGHDGTRGTGMSDPALAEDGVIRHHPGIQGISDLDPDPATGQGWNDPVARVVVTRIG